MKYGVVFCTLLSWENSDVPNTKGKGVMGWCIRDLQLLLRDFLSSSRQILGC